jgi:zinc transporter, ZIP family
MPEINENVPFAFLLTLLAGLATVVGAAIALFVRVDSRRPLAIGLAFSAGVMLYVSFTEILGKAHETIARQHAETSAAWLTAFAFFGGIVVIGLIDRLLPDSTNPHEPRAESEIDDLQGIPTHSHLPRSGPDAVPAARDAAKRALLRMGLFTALAIGLHNFPEGLATFVAALDNPRVGVAIAIAIALHNIPEGLSVAVPIFYATGSRKRAFWLASLSGLAEPVGAAIGYFVLAPYLNPTVMGVLFAAVAGIMVFISLDELFPTARAYSKGHEAVYGMVAGMAVMALSLLLMK